VNSFHLERVVPHYEILEFLTEQEKRRTEILDLSWTPKRFT
jgi:hypothetical protein